MIMLVVVFRVILRSDRNRDLILEAHISMLEKKIFSSNLKARCHRIISSEEQKYG